MDFTLSSYFLFWIQVQVFAFLFQSNVGVKRGDALNFIRQLQQQQHPNYI